jgi:electron transfer flavoprotein beta subunit
MKTVVLIKQVPDTYGRRTLRSDGTIDRDANDLVTDEINERAVELALQLKKSAGGDITVLTMGPRSAAESLRSALAMGGDRAIHINDEGLAGSDALQTSAALAAAIDSLEFDLIITGNSSTDGRTSAIPAMLAERLAVPHLTSLATVAIESGTITGIRVVEKGTMEVRAQLPAVISVTEKIAEPGFPRLKGILAAKRKPLATLSIRDLALSEAECGASNSWTQVREVASRPARAAGIVIIDDGTAGTQIADFLAAAKLI